MAVLVPGDFTGEAETAWVMDTLRTLVGGRVWETGVPDESQLARLTDGSVAPYIVVLFSEPSAVPDGRNIGSGEQGQPHRLTVTVIVEGASADDTRAVAVEVRRLLIGQRPSLTATPFEARGGFTWPTTDGGSVPTRYKRSVFARCVINI